MEDFKRDYRNLIRSRLTEILINYGYTLKFDNEVEDQKVSKNWVFKLIYAGKNTIEVSNNDYRDYTEYFCVKINEVEVMILNIDKYEHLEDAFEKLKTEIINRL